MLTNTELVRLFWGKAGRARVPVVHPALFHMIDVGMVARAMVERSPRTALRGLRLAADLSADEAARRIGFLIALHDLGKISPGFQIQRDDLTAEQRDRGYDFPETLEPDHSHVTLQHLRYMARDNCAAGVLARSIAAHHGMFHPTGAARQRRKDGLGLWWEAREAAIAALAMLFGAQSEAVLRPDQFTPAEGMILAGLTAVADWIGSDKRFFPPEGSPPRPLEAYATEAYGQAHAALDDLKWDPWQPDSEQWDFTSLFPNLPPNALQQLTMRLATELPEPAMVVIEAPMGMGKTEAALHLADVLLNRFGHAGLYDALPTQATSSQIFRRVRDDYLARRLAGRPANLHLLHGLAAFDDAYAEMLEPARSESPHPYDISDVDGRRGSPEAAVIAASWFRGRKLGLLSPFAVGTIDQALMGALQTRHMFVRLHGLANKVVLVDEAHAYDTYTSTLLDCLVEWLGVLGCSVIILSATLPAARRRGLARAYAGKGVALPAQAYPRVTTVTRGGEVRSDPIPGTPEKEVLLESLLAPDRADPEGVIIDRLAHELREGGCAAWICNTVDAAQLAYLRLARLREEGHPVFSTADLVLYHARFPVDQRHEIETAIDSKFGKKGLNTGQRPHLAVLIGTQVLEQALDYSVDVMVTELAPVDLVLQRSGRLHRHVHVRPCPLQQPRLLWLAPPPNTAGEPEFGVSGRIYEEVVLLRSWHALRQRTSVQIPHDIEALVEEVYSDPPPTLPEPLQAVVERLGREAETARQKHQGLALANAIHGPTEEDPFQMDRALPDEEAPTDVQGTPAVTRLAEPTITLVCAHRRGSEMVLSTDDSQPLDLSAPPDRDEEGRLLRRSVRVQNRFWVERFRDEPVPKGWKDSPALRHARLAVFADGTIEAGGRRLALDPELGLVTSTEVLGARPSA